MKIVNTLPKASQMFSHDSPVIRVVKLCLPAFILVSSLTVFLGVKAHLTDYLSDVHWLLANSLYSVAYLLFSLAPDVLNVVLIAYLTRSFLKGHYRDRLGMILLIAAGLMVIVLTRYSFLMSQTAAKSMVKTAAPKATVKSTAPIDSLYQSEVKSLQVENQNAVAAIERRYQELIAASTAPLAAQILPLQKRAEQWEISRSDQNTFYVDLQLKKLQDQIQPLEQERLNLEKRLVLQKSQELDLLNSPYKRKTDLVENRRNAERNEVLALNQSERNTINGITIIFTKQLSGIAGYAVFIVLLLAVIREILHFRNGIELQPIISPFDFQTKPLQETLVLPFTLVGRHCINWVRDQYRHLPSLKEPPTPPALKPYVYQQLSNLHLAPENKGLTTQNDPLNDYESLFNSQAKIPISLKEKPTLNGTYENGSGDEKVIIIEKPILRDCEFCGEGFTPNHKKQKYCRQEHRRLAWEEKTGRKLLLKRRKY